MVVVDHTGQTLSSATVLTKNTESAEQVAIALAITITRAKYIISDSKAAIRSYSKGLISQVAARILQQLRAPNYRTTKLVWTPAHEGLWGNEQAHTAACEIVIRAAINPPAATTERSQKVEALNSYKEITSYYKLNRYEFPAAHHTLNAAQAKAWRQLQTNTYPNPVAYSHFHPEIYSDTCNFCGHRADLTHIIWKCKKKPRYKTPLPPIDINHIDHWETLLRSSDPLMQLRLVQMAEEAARNQNLLAD